MREWLELELETLTPAFLSGADQKEADLRAASVRGLLRWWWRAAVGHEYPSPEELSQREAVLFGSAEHKLKSPVQVDIREIEVTRFDRAQPLPSSGFVFEWHRGQSRGNSDVLSYLAYGPVRPLARHEKRNGKAIDPLFNDPRSGMAKPGPLLLRPAYDAGSRFRLALAWQPGALTATQQDELVRATCA
jgi:RAMP superfamily